LPGPESVLAVLDRTEELVRASDPDVTEGVDLDRAMETTQEAIARLDVAIRDRYVAAAL
jgi:hypothetical protein